MRRQLGFFCAAQWQECTCDGEIRWGNNKKWQVVKLKPNKTTSQVTCAVGQSGLKDVRPGDNGKHCECGVHIGSGYGKSFNPMVFQDADVPEEAKVVGSCEMYQDQMHQGELGKKWWDAIKGFCGMNDGIHGGEKCLKPEDLRRSVKAYLDIRFTQNYARYYDSSGWAEYGFLSHCYMSTSSLERGMARNLIVSVQKFSKHPLILMNFGMVTPQEWNEEAHPQMVLLHSSPLPAHAARSASLDKLRAILLARLKVGIVVDFDGWVGPRVDIMFKRTQEEVTKEYPLPVLPVHFLDKKPEGDRSTWWNRFCPTGIPCTLQTTRWGHAHATWTVWALPFIGRWLRRNLRDETLHARSDMKNTPENRLRLGDVSGDEDLLNVAIWEEGGTKQWCKFDIPDPGEYESMLTAIGKKCKQKCEDIDADPRFQPEAIPKVYYTASHAVDPEASAKYLDRLEDLLNKGKLPPSIMYKGKFYEDADELRAAHPQLRCLV